jgi:hypothetical protein
MYSSSQKYDEEFSVQVIHQDFALFRFLTVFLCLFLSVVVTMPDYEHIASTVLLQTVNHLSNDLNGRHARSVFRCFQEIIVVVWLATELGLRVWSSGCRSRYQTKMGRLRFMRKPFCVLGQSIEHRTRGDGYRFSSPL